MHVKLKVEMWNTGRCGPVYPHQSPIRYLAGMCVKEIIAASLVQLILFSEVNHQVKH